MLHKLVMFLGIGITAYWVLFLICEAPFLASFLIPLCGMSLAELAWRSWRAGAPKREMARQEKLDHKRRVQIERELTKRGREAKVEAAQQLDPGPPTKEELAKKAYDEYEADCRICELFPEGATRSTAKSQAEMKLRKRLAELLNK